MGKNAQHTPGPWKVDSHDFGVDVFRDKEQPDGARGAGVCKVLGWGLERDANARLIAAAPEMFNAISVVLEVDALADWATESLPGEEQSIKQMLRAAIAKARGEV